MPQSSSLLAVCQAIPVDKPGHLTQLGYRTLHETGFLKLEHLIPALEVQEMSKHMDAVLAGTETAPGFPTVMESMSKAERIAPFNRIHDAHRVHALHERFLLHPRILDVLEQLTGPDVLALQSMTFFKQPGQPGQGYHQDSYYIPTLPNSLIAVWVAVSEATEENGCLWFCVGSQNEPLYPHPENEYTHASRGLDGVFDNTTASDDAVDTNQLAKVAERYPEIPCPAQPGDVIFFHGNILHRSHANASTAPPASLRGTLLRREEFCALEYGRALGGDGEWEGGEWVSYSGSRG